MVLVHLLTLLLDPPTPHGTKVHCKKEKKKKRGNRIWSSNQGQKAVIKLSGDISRLFPDSSDISVHIPWH